MTGALIVAGVAAGLGWAVRLFARGERDDRKRDLAAEWHDQPPRNCGRDAAPRSRVPAAPTVTVRQPGDWTP